MSVSGKSKKKALEVARQHDIWEEVAIEKHPKCREIIKEAVSCRRQYAMGLIVPKNGQAIRRCNAINQDMDACIEKNGCARLYDRLKKCAGGQEVDTEDIHSVPLYCLSSLAELKSCSEEEMFEIEYQTSRRLKAPLKPPPLPDFSKERK